jgi:hypothetical protein
MFETASVPCLGLPRRTSGRLLWAFVVFGIFLASWSREAQAVPIEYRIWATASGTLGTNSFSNAAITISLFGDTDVANAWTNSSSNGWQNFITPGVLSGSSITIDGVGSAFLGAVLLVANPNDYCQCIAMGPLVRGGADVFDLFFTEFTLANPYDLTTATGVIPGTVITFPFNSLNTSEGALSIYSGYDGYFQAILPVPLPAAAWLLAGGLGLLAPLRRRPGALPA